MDRIMENLRGAFTVWYRDVLRYLRDRSRIIGSLGMPLLFLFVLGTGLAPAMEGLGGGGIDFRKFLFPGIISMTVLFTSVFSAMSIVWDREFGFLKEVMVSPVSRVAIGLGKVAGGSTVALIQGGIILLLSPLLGISLSFFQVISLIGLMLLLAAVMTSLGLLIAARQRSMEGFQMIMNFLLLPMFFLSGALFPLQDLPVWMEVLTHADPVAYGVDPIRQVALQGTVPASMLDQLIRFPLVTNLLAMVGFAVVFLVPAVALFSKRD